MPDFRAHVPAPALPRGEDGACAALDAPSAELARLLVGLEEAVTRYVAGRRADGVPIARVLSEVRCVVREAESADGVFRGAEALMAQVVRWAVAASGDPGPG